MEPRKDELRAAARIGWAMSEVLVALLLLCVVSVVVFIPSAVLFFVGQVIHAVAVSNPIDITPAVGTVWLWIVGVYGAMVTIALMFALYGKVPFTVKDEDFITVWTMFAFAFPLVFGLLAPAMW